MTPAARIQAAIDIIDQVVAAARDNGPAADALIQRYFRDRRYAGSKDRRAIRDLVYAAIRRAGERPAGGRAAVLGLVEDDPALGALFDGSPHGPAPIAEDEAPAPAGLVPHWLASRLSHLSAADLDAMRGRAPLDLRVNLLKADRAAVIADFPGSLPLPLTDAGVRLGEAVAIERHMLFQNGIIEIQDDGSQRIAQACAAGPGDLVVDLCAGAGGKALALAAAMANKGRIIACDADRARLARLAPRAERAGVSIIAERLLDGGREGQAVPDLVDQADVVLVDAPCSGTGTWRRNPEARWRLTAERLERLTALQARLMTLGASLVKPGGRLVYAVCSLLKEEGEMQLARFQAEHPDWHVRPLAGIGGRDAGGGRLLTPLDDGTDGFFVASIERPC